MATGKKTRGGSSRWIWVGCIAGICTLVCIVMWWLWAQRSPILIEWLPGWAVPAEPVKEKKSSKTAQPKRADRSEKTDKNDKAEQADKVEKAVSGVSQTTPEPSRSATGSASGTASGSVSGTASASASVKGAASPAPGQSAPPSRAVSHPILLVDEGKSTVLDVQSVMALQRTQAERRLYDRVLALSTTGGSPATVAGLAAPRASSADTALKALTGHTGAGQAVASFEAKLPPGAPPSASDRIGNAVGSAAIGDALSKTARLLSVYVRENFWLAEVLLPNGRRIELELHDQLAGYHVSRIDETGVLLMPVIPSEGKKRFLAVGDRLVLSEASWRQSSID